MSETCVVGVDIGTQGAKAVLYSLDGKRLAEAFRPSRILEPAPGALTEDPDDQYASVCGTVSECMVRSGVAATQIACVAIAGQMAGILGVDANGRHVTPYDSWLDTRCTPYIVWMRDRAGDAVLRLTGNEPSINHGPKILWWKHEHPEVYDTVAAFVQPGAYAAMRLTGLRGADAFIDSTYLHFSGFADNVRARWDPDLCEAFDVDVRKLPRIVRAEEIAGRVTSDAARLTGLAQGTPVAAGCGDTAASFLSCGAVEPGICVDVAGTASVFSITSDRYIPDESSRTLGCSRAVAPALWHHFAYINGGGMNLEWFRKTLGSVDPRAIDVTGFDALNEMASRVEPAMTDPYFIPHTAGRVMPSAPGLRGAWVNLSWSHGLGHLYRSTLEAVALEYGVYLQALRRLDPSYEPREIRVTGGGAGSSLWNRIKSDVAQTPVRVVPSSTGAPVGSAMLAARAADPSRDIKTIARTWVRTGDVTHPDERTAAFYQARGEWYARFVAALTTVAPEDEP